MSEKIPTTFASMELDDRLLQGLEKLGFETPTPIQAAAIPPLLRGEDVLGQAQTGTGKTAAFALPLIQQIDLDHLVPQLLILAPTRELAKQVCAAIDSYGRYIKGLRLLAVYGGQGMGIQLRDLKQGVHVIVGTPGRLIDHLKRGTMKLGNLRAVVLDEADEMLTMGFIEEVEALLEAAPSENLQVALFSATMPKQIKRIAKRFQNNPVEIRLKNQSTTLDTIRQSTMYVGGPQKVKALDRFLEIEDVDGVIVFVRTKAMTLDLVERLSSLGHNCAALNGDMAQPLRERTVQHFKRGGVDVLVCTDVAARGLDVPRISHVINYDIPHDAETYTHRIGRTGRAGREGHAILFAGRSDQHALRRIEKSTRQTIERIPAPTGAEVSQHRVKALRDSVGRIIETQDLGAYSELLQTIEESEHDIRDIAAALLVLSQQHRPLFIEDDVLEDRERSRRKNDRNSRNDRYDRNDRNDRGGRGGRGGRDNNYNDRGGVDYSDNSGKGGKNRVYRIEVGREHGVEPKHIVGAIANETGMTSRNIGAIRIRDTYTVVDLPPNLPGEIINTLQKTWVCGRQLRLQELTAGSPGYSSPDAPKSRGKFRKNSKSSHHPGGKGKGTFPKRTKKRGNKSKK